MVICLLGALVIWLGGVLQETSVLNGDGIALGWGWAVALLQDSLSETHDCFSVVKVACIRKGSSGGSCETWKTAGERGKHLEG